MPTPTPVRPVSSGRAPTLEDPLAAYASAVVGGPLGRYAAIGRRGFVPAAAVLTGAASVLIALGAATRSYCVATGWRTPDQFWHACYSDMPVVFRQLGLGSAALPYTRTAPRLDQPLVSGIAMWLLARLVPPGSPTVQQAWYFALWALVVLICMVLLVQATVRCVPTSPWRAAHLALSPVLVTASLVSVDLLGVVLTTLGLWAWSRRRTSMAGVLLGLAVLTRSYPLVVLAALGLLALRTGRLRDWAATAGTALVTSTALLLPWVAGGGTRVLSAYGAWWSAGAGYGSVWELPELVGQAQAAHLAYRQRSGFGGGGWLTSVHFGAVSPLGATLLTLLGWVVAVALGAVFALVSPRRPRVAEVALLMVGVVVLTGKSMPVQASLWVLPLVALVGLRWRDHLIWAGAELLYFFAVWLYLAGRSVPDRALPAGWFGAILCLRVAAWVYLLVRVCRATTSSATTSAATPAATSAAAMPAATPAATSAAGMPAATPAERDELDLPDDLDELAGPLAGAADRVLVRFG